MKITDPHRLRGNPWFQYIRLQWAQVQEKDHLVAIERQEWAAWVVVICLVGAGTIIALVWICQVLKMKIS